MRYAALFRLALPGLGLGLLLPVLSGCGPGIGTVSGRVTYKGQPVPGGLVTFRPVDGRQNSVTVELDSEGRYSATLLTGEATVTIDNRELEPRSGIGIPSLPANLPLSGEARAKLGGGKAAPPAPTDGPPKTGEDERRPSGRYLPIPLKYYDAETSGLTLTVKSGAQPYDIELTD